MDAWLGRDIEIAELAQQSWWDFGGDRHWLIAMAAGNVVEVRDEPFVALARSNPHRVSVEAKFVATSDGRPELVELRFDRFVGAGDHPNSFEFAQLGVLLPHRNRS